MYDVAVVGAGPAGSTVSYCLAKEKIKVILFERHRFPRRKACAAGLSLYSIELLKELGLFSEEYIVNETHKCKIDFVIAKEVFEADAHICLTTREQFDEYLARRAQEAGAELHEGEGVKSISIKDDFVEIRTSKAVYRSKVVVLACGQPNVLGKSIGLYPNYGKAIAFEFNAPLPTEYNLDYCEFYFSLDKDFAGYFWIFPKKGFANYGVGTWLHTVTVMKKKYGSVVEWTKSILKDLGYWNKIKDIKKHLTKIKGAIVPVYTNAKAEDMVMDRAIAIGDAAGLVRYSGEGICYALKSGQLAAKALMKCIEENKFDKQTLVKYYTEPLDKEVLRELKYTSKIEKIMTYATDAVIDLLKKEPEVLNLLGKMLEHSISDEKYFNESSKYARKHISIAARMMAALLRGTLKGT